MPRKRSVDLRALGNFSSARPFATAWVLTCAGLLSGHTYFGPYEFADINTDTKELVINHRGLIELVTPNGDHFAFQHDR
jgi:hypothetical protein